MNKLELRKCISSTLKKSEVNELVELVIVYKIELIELLDLCYDERIDIAFRASWILEYIASKSPVLFVSIFVSFISRLPNQKNRSCQRHFTKILMYLTQADTSGLYQEAMAKLKNKQELVEVVFNWCIERGTPVAVRVNCLDILFNMSRESPWITNELKLQIDFFMLNGSAALQSRGKKVLEKINRSL